MNVLLCRKPKSRSYSQRTSVTQLSSRYGKRSIKQKLDRLKSFMSSEKRSQIPTNNSIALQKLRLLQNNGALSNNNIDALNILVDDPLLQMIS